MLKSKQIVDPRADPTSIGNIAIQRGYATPMQVAYALKKQEERQPLGMLLLLEQGVITEMQLEELLVEQEATRRRLSSRKVSQLWVAHKRQKMKEVANGIKETALALRYASKYV